MKRLLIIAGDPSGDLIASQLVESVKRLEPNVLVTGIGGERLKAVSDRFLEDIVSRHALGFAISPKKLFYFRHVLNDIVIPEIRENPPDAVVPVDFYGFNSLVAHAAKGMGRRVLYYVSPQFWASRPGRAERLRSSVDLFLCLFPFELEFYRKRKIPAQFVGHPILDVIPRLAHDRPMPVEPVVGLLPGSRPDEIERHLPIMVGACERISAAAPGTRYMLFTVPNVPRQLYHDLLGTAQPSQSLIELIQDENYRWRSQLDLAITASGMETLENALLGIPMVVMYKMNWLTFLIAKSLIRIPHVGMPNVLSGREMVPELIQWRATPERVAAPIIDWIKEPASRRALRRQLLDLRQQFGGEGASERAARAILEKVA